MFSVEEKKKIADVIEKTLLEFNHPEMPKEKPKFKIHIDGKEKWSWADIEPNWVFEDGKKMDVNPFNENVRKGVMKKLTKLMTLQLKFFIYQKEKNIVNIYVT